MHTYDCDLYPGGEPAKPAVGGRKPPWHHAHVSLRRLPA
jgi:hypothetical protein